ncbi:MAG: hypothetical protein ACE5E6_12270 [Phycisphaerae bacterium]
MRFEVSIYRIPGTLDVARVCVRTTDERRIIYDARVPRAATLEEQGIVLPPMDVMWVSTLAGALTHACPGAVVSVNEIDRYVREALQRGRQAPQPRNARSPR